MFVLFLSNMKEGGSKALGRSDDLQLLLNPDKTYLKKTAVMCLGFIGIFRVN